MEDCVARNVAGPAGTGSVLVQRISAVPKGGLMSTLEIGTVLECFLTENRSTSYVMHGFEWPIPTGSYSVSKVNFQRRVKSQGRKIRSMLLFVVCNREDMTAREMRGAF